MKRSVILCVWILFAVCQHSSAQNMSMSINSESGIFVAEIFFEIGLN